MKKKYFSQHEKLLFFKELPYKKTKWLKDVKFDVNVLFVILSKYQSRFVNKEFNASNLEL